MNPVERAAAEVVSAWRRPGVAPGYHFRQMERLRREWPTLARAVEQLVEASK